METGTSSGKMSAAAQSAFHQSTISALIKKKAFTNNGNGTWSIDIDGVGGGQILDETGGSRDPMMGRGGKVYSITAWDADYSQIGPVQIVTGSLNQAKRELKDTLRSHHGLMG